MNENLALTAVREDVYRLLAACYYPPSAAFIQEKCAESLAKLLENVIPEAGRYASEAVDTMGEDPECLAVEHARLFIGPFQLVAVPYGSVYLDDNKSVMGSSTSRVDAFYRSCGLQLADDFHELPDHFAVELEFMSFLAFKQREASASGNTSETTRLINLQKEFLEKFLLPWLKPFTSAIIDDAESGFYLAIARTTRSFVTMDHLLLSEKNNG